MSHVSATMRERRERDWYALTYWHLRCMVRSPQPCDVAGETCAFVALGGNAPSPSIPFPRSSGLQVPFECPTYHRVHC